MVPILEWLHFLHFSDAIYRGDLMYSTVDLPSVRRVCWNAYTGLATNLSIVNATYVVGRMHCSVSLLSI